MAKRVFPKHSFTACLLATGWRRNEEPWGEDSQWGPGECTDVNGCSRPGRWTHDYVSGEYCGHHAHQATENRRWGTHTS